MGKLLAALVVTALCVTAGWAVELDPPGMDELLGQAEEYGVSSHDTLDGGLARLWDQAKQQAGTLLRGQLHTVVKLLAVALLCAVAQELDRGSGGLRPVELAGVLAITALTMTDMAAMVGLGRETMGKMDLFSRALLPVMAVLTAATGGITVSAVRQGATVLFSQLLITGMDRLFLPLVYAYVAVSCAYAVVGNPGLDRLAAGLKSGITGLLTLFLLAFVGYLTASGAIAGSADAAAVKTAKLAISRAIPVVGGILADASETVLAGAGVLRGTVGAVGMLTVLAICLTPFLHLGLHYLLYKGAAVLCAVVLPSRLTGLIEAIGGAFGLVMGMTGAAALVLLISLASSLTAVLG